MSSRALVATALVFLGLNHAGAMPGAPATTITLTRGTGGLAPGSGYTER
jgi:hypothetical protein